LTEAAIAPSGSLKNVRYEIRGRLARRAQELQRQGCEIITLNIGRTRRRKIASCTPEIASSDILIVIIN